LQSITYNLPRKLQVGGGVQYVGSRTASSTAPLDPTTHLVKQVPGYWLFNAMTKYPITERVDLQLNLYNLTNKYYYDEIHPALIVLGAGFTASLGLNFRF
jgi:catecholate siderophore receptor